MSSRITHKLWCFGATMLCSIAMNASGHSGGLDSSGCHAGSQPYHCHRASSDMVGNRLRCDLGSRSSECGSELPDISPQKSAKSAGDIPTLTEPSIDTSAYESLVDLNLPPFELKGIRLGDSAPKIRELLGYGKCRPKKDGITLWCEYETTFGGVEAIAAVEFFSLQAFHVQFSFDRRAEAIYEALNKKYEKMEVGSQFMSYIPATPNGAGAVWMVDKTLRSQAEHAYTAMVESDI